MPLEAETNYNEVVYGGQNYIESPSDLPTLSPIASVDDDPYADEIADGEVISTININRHEDNGKKLNDIIIDGQIHAVNVPDDLITNIISNLVCPVSTSVDEESVYRSLYDDADETD